MGFAIQIVNYWTILYNSACPVFQVGSTGSMNHFDGHTKGRSYSTSSTSSSHSYNDSFYQRAPGSEREDFNQVLLSFSFNKKVKFM